MSQLDAESIINQIATSKKQTPVKAFLSGSKLYQLEIPSSIEAFIEQHSGVIFGDWNDVKAFLKNPLIEHYHIENTARNSAVPLLDLKEINARIEPGAIIRNQVLIGDNAVIMMGAIINIGAEIGDNTMIDMGVVLGGRALVGKNCHIGAGAVLAGVVEPASATPVQIDDNVLVGANAVVIEGVHVGEGAVVAAGSIVTKDVPAHSVVAGVPARVVKMVDEQTSQKTALEEGLRNL
ncbi:2,3,4,5-tetrahydropyridine-2,6-dicarboxylate N-acetyltransferase [Pediococcus claussenii]|uniref:2,3,4,5-tetrahydropyridine-2,6-dicarboxylate N-acetyltransferase n=1 Tax=Pediococcus claussenii (strain ATCC BAA-344 / DSM 14800 / JCM 18046 / KCTC 3811 / LMG 21948 / P06) TaxID=701521 RepID=G8PEU4_PEDCP|nr:2,3,4,5-tetrahydropyridine-2,6-dicarboxylate N-acetyltransferase [Pediococcus claussenii]AEV94474.1 2,3,4,5-tetrahydropyridine-2,6-dicarboxylate N-acetyltransferase [Pediococcus claussenii ATCC BAA-344]ANZ69693.1 2,3,4,5-tetrahydropyridine-2,6-dicarboxylate N-acetyltransferase [Pediococcus claussenii]ANZ71510.1 2,3,4,5-tetrahydropyridine-2,6-dicarboxylate N-acetyltransferase [Pediococcus claussenii]KRN19818.1 dapD protein [Pediococcus claussenii]